MRVHLFLSARTFSSLDEVRGNGSLLLNVSTDPGIIGQFVVFPNMRFNCHGHINKVKFLAKPSNDTENPQFALGRFKPDGYYKIIYWPVNNTNKSGTIVEQSYHLGHMNYKDGDVFAMQYSDSDSNLFYNMDKMIYLYTCSQTNGPQMFGCIWGQGYQPLVTVETGKKQTRYDSDYYKYSLSTDHQECTSGFLGDDAFEYITNATVLTTHHSKQSLQKIRVTCSGASINKWIVGATTSLQVPPEIMLCNLSNSCKHWFHLTMLNTTSHLNVYEYKLHPKFIIPGNMYLVVNSSQIYYQRCALEGCVDQPLVAVELTGEYTDCGVCVDLIIYSVRLSRFL